MVLYDNRLHIVSFSCKCKVYTHHSFFLDHLFLILCNLILRSCVCFVVAVSIFWWCSGSGTTTPVTTTPSTRVPTTTNTRPYTSSTGGGLGIPSGIPDYTDPSSGFKLHNPRDTTFFVSGLLVFFLFFFNSYLLS